MAECMAPAWPSQRRAGGNSERHSALARMRARRERSECTEESWPSRPPRPRSKGGDGNAVAAESPRSGGPGLASPHGSPPWAPPWNPDDGPPPKPLMPQPPGEARHASRGADMKTPRRPEAEPPASRRDLGASGQDFRSSRDHLNASGSSFNTPQRERATRRSLDDEFEDGSRSARAPGRRGPAEVRAARGGGADEEPLPPGARGADFKTLQDMIEKGIKDAEKGNSQMEADIRATNDDSDLQRHKEALRRRREEETQARQHEKDIARERRRKEDEARRRKLEEQMEREEEQERWEQDEKAAKEALCLRQFRAVVRIQAHIRGRRSRAGKHIISPAVRPVRHTQPWGQDTDLN